MLTQLSRLALESDGRYASAEELQFLKDYVQTAQQRSQVYKTIRDQEAFLLEELHTQVKTTDAGSLFKGSQDVSNFFKRDQKHILRVASASMLFNDLDFLREGLLLWHRTIIKAFGVERPAQVACQIWPSVMLKYLSTDEYASMSPVVGLIRAILG
jgi:Phycobilisome protein